MLHVVIALAGTAIALLGALIATVFRTGQIVERIGRFEKHEKHLDDIPKIMGKLETMASEQQYLRNKVSEFSELKSRLSVLEATVTPMRPRMRSRQGDDDE